MQPASRLRASRPPAGATTLLTSGRASLPLCPLPAAPAGPSEYVQGLSYEECATLLNVDVGDEALMNDIYDTGGRWVAGCCWGAGCCRGGWALLSPSPTAVQCRSAGPQSSAGSQSCRLQLHPPTCPFRSLSLLLNLPHTAHPSPLQPLPSSSASTATASCCSRHSTLPTTASTTAATAPSARATRASRHAGQGWVGWVGGAARKLPHVTPTASCCQWQLVLCHTASLPSPRTLPAALRALRGAAARGGGGAAAAGPPPPAGPDGGAPAVHL